MRFRAQGPRPKVTGMRIEEMLAGAGTLAIAGHVSPDGDCVGSCMGLYLYVKKNMPEIRADVYLEDFPAVFSYIESIEDVKHCCDPEKKYDLFLTLDASSVDRIGVAGCYLETARRTVCIDHHFTNPGFGMVNVIDARASSACEVLYGLLDPEKLDRAVAEAIYTGIIHDSGVFQYTNTRPETLRIAASLLEKGIDFSAIIDHSFYERTHAQGRILGKVLETCRLYHDGQIVVGVVTPADLEAFRVTKKDLDGIVSQLRYTKGIETAIFIYPVEEGVYKVSLRSNETVDVSAAAMAFGGGGHVKAAGCSLEGSPEEITEKLLAELEKQLRQPV